MIAAQSRSAVRFCDLLPGVSCPAELSETTVAGLTHDSRQVRSGDVFVALPGPVNLLALVLVLGLVFVPAAAPVVAEVPCACGKTEALSVPAAARRH